MTIQISIKRNDWVFHTGPWFWPFVSWWTNPNVWTLRFWNFQQFVSIFHFHLGIRRYCVCCLSIATKQSGDDIHDLSCCHLRCWRSLFSEYCIRTWVIFYNKSAKYNSTLKFLVLCLQFSIFQMTYGHEWWKMNCSARRPCFIDHLFLTFDFCQVPRRKFLQFFPFLVHCCFCCWNFHGLRHRNKFVNQINAVMNSHLFLQYGLRDLKVRSFPYAFWWIHQLPEYTQVLSYFCQIRHSHNSS